MCTRITLMYGSFLYFMAVSNLIQHEQEFNILPQLLLRYGSFSLPGCSSAALQRCLSLGKPRQARAPSPPISRGLTERSHRSCLRSSRGQRSPSSTLTCSAFTLFSTSICRPAVEARDAGRSRCPTAPLASCVLVGWGQVCWWPATLYLSLSHAYLWLLLAEVSQMIFLLASPPLIFGRPSLSRPSFSSSSPLHLPFTPPKSWTPLCPLPSPQPGGLGAVLPWPISPHTQLHMKGGWALADFVKLLINERWARRHHSGCHWDVRGDQDTGHHTGSLNVA